MKVRRDPLLRWFSGRMNVAEAEAYRGQRQKEARARTEYDRLFRFLRGMQAGEPRDEGEALGDELSPIEIEVVGERLFALHEFEEQKQSLFVRLWERVKAEISGSRSQKWQGGLAAGVAALAVLIWLREEPRPSLHGATPAEKEELVGLVARGGSEGAGFAIEVFCGSPAAPIVDGICPIDQDLSFAFQLEDGEQVAHSLSLFGIDERGELMYYFPNPADSSLPQSTSDKWTAVADSVRLEVNHQVGALQIFALSSPEALSVQDLEGLHKEWTRLQVTAEELFELEAGASSWLDKLSPATQQQICPENWDRAGQRPCRSAFTKLRIVPAKSPSFEEINR